MRIVWEEVLPRLKSVEIDGHVSGPLANVPGGPEQLPIRFVME
jgi:hypothetical protein